MINAGAVGGARSRGRMFTCEIRRPYGAGRSHPGCPAGDFDHGGDRTGRYRTTPADADSRISYADFAIALLDEIDTPKHHRTHLGAYSGGMLRRVGVAQALLGDPRVLIVDEPTAGLDPEERVRFRTMLSDLAADRVVLLSTHIVSDIESVASDIAIVARGRLLRRGSPEELLREVDGQVWETVAGPSDAVAMRERYVISRMIRTAGGTRLRFLSPTPPGGDAVRVAPDLEDVYLAVINGPAARTPQAVGTTVGTGGRAVTR